jgi:exopolysaccharide production protein ExoQ
VRVAPATFEAPPLQHRLVTWLVQVPLLFYAAHGSFSLFSLNGADAVGGSIALDTYSDGGPTRIIVYGSTLLAILLMLPLATSAFSLFARNRYVAAVVVFATVSVLWSQQPTDTIQKDVYLIVSTCFGLYLIERFPPRQLMQVFMITGSLTMVISLFLAVALPRYGIYTGREDSTSGWQGIYSHKNMLGIMTVYFLAPALFLPVDKLKGKLWRICYIGAGVFLIAMSRSRGAWIMCACLVAFAVAITVGKQMKPRERVAAGWALAVAFVLGGFGIWTILPMLLQFLGKDMTLTGRTAIWSALLTSFAKRPWLGYGYSAFWEGTRGESANAIYAIKWARLSYAENGVLELALELGAVGVILYVLAYMQSFRRLGRLFSSTSDRPELFWYASTLFLAVITNIEAGSIASPNSMEWLVFVIMAGGIQKAYLEVRQPEAARGRFGVNARLIRSGTV